MSPYGVTAGLLIWRLLSVTACGRKKNRNWSLPQPWCVRSCPLFVDEYPNLDLLCNARADSVIYDLAPQPTGRRGRPAKHGERLSIKEDFTLSAEKIGDYYMGVRRVLTNIFGQREVPAYVTSTEKTGGSRRLFFSTIIPEQMQIFCAWQEKAPLNQTGSERMQFIPLLCYTFRWNIEVSYYEQKTFWSLCSYMLRSREGIEMLVNLINIPYCAMKILPYQEESFSKYRTESVQEFRFALSEQIRQQSRVILYTVRFSYLKRIDYRTCRVRFSVLRRSIIGFLEVGI